MIKPVIAVTLFRRPEYTRRLFDALSQREGIERIPAIVSVDFKEEYAKECAEVLEIARRFAPEWKDAYGWINIHAHRKNLGIDLNKLFVIPKAFERGNFVIFLEDDHITSKDALRWFIGMGERFEHDERIGFITGYNRQTKEEFEESSPGEFFIKGLDDGEPGFCPTGWATWKDRWDYFFPDNGEEYKRICGERANGLFDHYVHLRRGEKLYKHSNPETVGMNKPKWPGLIVPKIARIQSIGAENATHTPSPEWHREHEFNEFWMGSL